jgi:CheY-like chemotaxis protein
MAIETTGEPDSPENLLHDLATPLLVAKLNAALLDEYLPALIEDLMGSLHGKELLPKDEKVLKSLLLAPSVMSTNLTLVQRKIRQLSDLIVPNDQSLESETLIGKSSSKFSAESVKTVLLVDDELIHRDIAEYLLSPLYKVDYASNGIEAMVLCKLHQYDLILMDLQMPKMNGEQATIELRQGINCETLVIGLTDMPTGSKRSELLNKGFNDFLEKPLKLERLRALLQQHTKHKS